MANGRGSAKHADFIGVPRNVARARSFIDAPPLARALYLDLRRQFNGHNNGQIAAVLEGTEERPGLAAYGWPPRSVFKYIKVLLEHGLIERTRQGGIASMSKVCSLYAFTDLPVMANKEKGIAGSQASLAYLNFTPKERARRTRQKQTQDARGAHIDARGAGTHMHAVPTEPPTTARGAVSDSPEKETQPDDAVTVFHNSDAKSAKPLTTAPCAHPYNLSQGQVRQ